MLISIFCSQFFSWLSDSLVQGDFISCFFNFPYPGKSGARPSRSIVLSLVFLCRIIIVLFAFLYQRQSGKRSKLRISWTRFALVSKVSYYLYFSSLLSPQIWFNRSMSYYFRLLCFSTLGSLAYGQSPERREVPLDSGERRNLFLFISLI